MNIRLLGLILAGLLMLVSCAPSLTSTLQRNNDTVRIQLNAGSQPALDIALLISGNNLEPFSDNAKSACTKTPNGKLGCDIADLAANTSWEATVRGQDVRCNVTFYRPNESIPQVSVCQVQ
jgi:hypothetical protein